MKHSLPLELDNHREFPRRILRILSSSTISIPSIRSVIPSGVRILDGSAIIISLITCTLGKSIPLYELEVDWEGYWVI